MKRLRDINYSYLAFGENLKEFKGFLGNFKNIGENIWIDADNGDLLGNFEINNPNYGEIIFEEGQAFLVITSLSESFCENDLEIIVGFPEDYHTYDGYLHMWYYDNDTKTWDQCESNYYRKLNLIDVLENDSNPLMIVSVEVNDAFKLLNYIKQKLQEIQKTAGEKLFYWE